MRSTLVSLVSMCTLAMATPHFNIGKRCEAVEVQFHYNDTTIGTTQSCTKDVMYRGGSGAAPAVRRKYCIDGPSVNYTVVSGDTLEKIAAEYNSGVCNIASASGLSNPDFLGLGQILVVPTNVCTADNDSCRTVAGTALCVAASAGVASTYAIQSGDTFFLVSSKLGITLDALVAANPGVDAGLLQIGQIINIPICTA